MAHFQEVSKNNQQKNKNEERNSATAFLTRPGKFALSGFLPPEVPLYTPTPPLTPTPTTLPPPYHPTPPPPQRQLALRCSGTGSKHSRGLNCSIIQVIAVRICCLHTAAGTAGARPQPAGLPLTLIRQSLQRCVNTGGGGGGGGGRPPKARALFKYLTAALNQLAIGDQIRYRSELKVSQ